MIATILVSEVEFFAAPPRPALQPFVESVWGVRGSGALGAEAVLPNGAVELMVNFGPLQEVIGRGERPLADTYRHAWLAGIHDRRLVHASERGCDHIAVRFRPGGAHAFFDLRMDEAANQVIELDLLIGAEAASLRDRLGEQPSDGARVEAFQDWLLERRRVRRGFATVDRATMLLAESQARAPVAELCRALGISNKHLVEQFRRLVGVPPKVLGRILRFQRVVTAFEERRAMDWADLGFAAGYADQSHLIREFRRLAGVTPTEFARRGIAVAPPEPVNERASR